MLPWTIASKLLFVFWWHRIPGHICAFYMYPALDHGLHLITTHRRWIISIVDCMGNPFNIQWLLSKIALASFSHSSETIKASGNQILIWLPDVTTRNPPKIVDGSSATLILIFSSWGISVSITQKVKHYLVDVIISETLPLHTETCISDSVNSHT